MAQKERTPRLPVTVLTGFLGAGKTSRLNATLTQGLSKVAVIENEIGSLGVDGALVANRHDDGVIELSNGCLCCSAEVDLVAALEALAHRRETTPFERVIIETTGLADIAPVVSLVADPDDPLAEDFVFDGVVTVVDAANFRTWAAGAERVADAVHMGSNAGPISSWASGFGSKPLPASGEGQLPEREMERAGPGREAAQTAFWKQVALADRVIISKADLVGEADLEEARRAIASVNPVADVCVDACASGNTAGPLPLSCGPSNPHLWSVGAAAAAAPTKKTFCGASQKRRRGDGHLAGVCTVTVHLAAGRPVHAGALRALCENLLSGACDRRDESAEDLGEAWRVKGLVVAEGDGPMLLQGVGDQVLLEPWHQEMPRGSFLVIIGERLSKERVEAAMLACATGKPLPQLPQTE